MHMHGTYSTGNSAGFLGATGKSLVKCDTNINITKEFSIRNGTST